MEETKKTWAEYSTQELQDMTMDYLVQFSGPIVNLVASLHQRLKRLEHSDTPVLSRTIPHDPSVRIQDTEAPKGRQLVNRIQDWDEKNRGLQPDTESPTTDKPSGAAVQVFIEAPIVPSLPSHLVSTANSLVEQCSKSAHKPEMYTKVMWGEMPIVKCYSHSNNEIIVFRERGSIAALDAKTVT